MTSPAGAPSGGSDGRGRAPGTFRSRTSRARGDAAGAVSARREPRRRGGALHRLSGACASRLGWRPRAFPLAFPRFPQTALHDSVPRAPLGSSASTVFAGCWELGGFRGKRDRHWGHTPWARRPPRPTLIAPRGFRPGVRVWDRRVTLLNTRMELYGFSAGDGA